MEIEIERESSDARVPVSQRRLSRHREEQARF
jgi:hypothetical protein